MPSPRREVFGLIDGVANSVDSLLLKPAQAMTDQEWNSALATNLGSAFAVVRAAEAVALFYYQAGKSVGASAAARGGLDTLVFAGGICKHAPLVRARICEGLPFLGIELHASRNAEAADVISTDASRTTVRVIRTDDELMIARSVLRASHHHASRVSGSSTP